MCATVWRHLVNATEVNVGLAESNGSLPPGGWLKSHLQADCLYTGIRDQAVSPPVTLSHPPGGRLPLLSARPAVTFPAKERHRPLAKLYCSVTKAHGCEQLPQGCYSTARRPGLMSMVLHC